MLRRLTVHGNASRSEHGPQGQARDANECCLKALGQIKRQLDSLFAIALDIEMDHHCGKRHYPFPCSDRRKLLASFSNAP